ncbi:uncharacterized protein LOC144467735 [Augochlora pura]
MEVIVDTEELEKIQRQKEEAMEDRRRLLLKKSDLKHRLRQQHIERRAATEAEERQRVKEAFDLKLINDFNFLKENISAHTDHEQQETYQKIKARNSCSIVPDHIIQNLETKLNEEKQKDATRLNLPDAWLFRGDTPLEELEKKKLTYRRELQNQQIDNRRKKRELEEEKHRERKILEETGETLRREDLEAEKMKKEKVALLQAEKDAFLKARQIWKNKRREVLKQEHDEIQKIINKKEILHKREAEQKTDTQAGKEEMAQKVGKQIQDAEFKRLERETICRDLYLAEKENKLANEVIRLALQKKHTAKELMQDMVRQRRFAAEKKAKDDAVDAAFARYLAEERKKLETAEKEKEEKRREEVMRYGNELRETIARNRVQFEQETARRRVRVVAARQDFKGKRGDGEICALTKVKCHSDSGLKHM